MERTRQARGKSGLASFEFHYTENREKDEMKFCVFGKLDFIFGLNVSGEPNELQASKHIIIYRGCNS